MLEKNADLPFSVLAEGPFNPKDIWVSPTNKTIKHSSELDDYIENNWQNYIKDKPTKAFNNSMLLFTDAFSLGRYLILETGLTDFKERVATQKKEILQKYGMEAVSVTLGVGVLSITADNKVVVAQRLTYHPRKKGGLHNIGGIVDQKKDITSGSPDLIKALAREMEEETGIINEEFQLTSCLGLIQSTETYACDLLFLAKTFLTAEEIKMRKNDQELALRFIPNTPEDIGYTLLRNLKTASGPCIALLYLYGKQTFGKDWADFVKERFARRKALYDTFSPELSEKMRARLEKQLKNS